MSLEPLPLKILVMDTFIWDFYSSTSEIFIPWEQLFENSIKTYWGGLIHWVLFFDEHKLDHGDEPYPYTNLT